MKCSSYFMTLAVAVLAIGGLVAPAGAQGVTPPDLDVCDNVNVCDPARTSVCKVGFRVRITSNQPTLADSGTAIYTYEVCSPALGACSIGGGECSGNSQCELKCAGGGPSGPKCSGTGVSCTTDADCAGTCDRDCAVDQFQELSHFDVPLIDLGACVAPSADVDVTCSRGEDDLTDGSCFDSSQLVAKCNNPNLSPGQCLTMTVSITGELTGLGQGAAIVVDKEGNDCTSACIQGPSCEPCNGGPGNGNGECLTRTRGFWGTHPHIADDYLDPPVIVCGKTITGTAFNSCSTSEALCTSANDRKQNPEYLTLVAQLTAAKLNLNATAELFGGATCSEFTFNNGFSGKTIQEIIDYCEANFCGASKKDISDSGCIEALDAFNNSQDTGFDVTPEPFDRPGPAQPAQCQAARGNGKAIGYGVCP